MFLTNCKHISYKQGQYVGKIREYFYYINHEGMLFLDDSRYKNFTSAYKDVDFLNFFYKQLRLNETDRYKDSFPYLSRCGREHNFLRCDDRPIVFTDILDNGTMMRIGQSARTYPFQPTTLSMLRNGRLYHKAPFEEYGLIVSKTADKLFPLFTFDGHGFPVRIRWNGEVYDLSNEIRRKVEP
ncbi:Protein rhodnius neglectus [Trichostrongylus colubriformis]|uniref:Protein rhodnius neglectus n=1 Tax=Trichostrongylus colubriformis TaxID=6319 RepID=A0AAN8FKS2_TRICO